MIFWLDMLCSRWANWIASCPSVDPETVPVDPFLVAARMTEDAVLGYHTALEFHGRAYSVHWRLVYVSATKSLPLTFQSHEFRRAPVPPPLLAKGE